MKRGKKNPTQLDREIAESLAARSTRRGAKATTARQHHSTRKYRVHGADTWDVAMDALLEDNPAEAARIVRALRAEYGGTAPPTKEFSRAVEAVSDTTREDFFERLGELDAKHAALQESPFKKTEWLREAIKRFPLGTRVRVVRSDVDEYVGQTGTVHGYDLALEDHGSWPGFRVKLGDGATSDTFYADGSADDEIVRARSKTRAA